MAEVRALFNGVEGDNTAYSGKLYRPYPGFVYRRERVFPGLALPAAASRTLAALRLGELKDSLHSITENMNLGILDGNKVLEVKDAFVNKGIAASEWLRGETYDFIFAVGDDHTDEDLFDVLPEKAYSVKVGMALSRARFHIRGWKELRVLLKKFGE